MKTVIVKPEQLKELLFIETSMYTRNYTRTVDYVQKIENLIICFDNELGNCQLNVGKIG